MWYLCCLLWLEMHLRFIRLINIDNVTMLLITINYKEMNLFITTFPSGTATYNNIFYVPSTINKFVDNRQKTNFSDITLSPETATHILWAITLSCCSHPLSVFSRILISIAYMNFLFHYLNNLCYNISYP